MPRIPVIQKYLAISNRNSEKLRKECADGGVVCALKQEIIQADTNIALAKNDPLGRIYLGRYLQNDDVIKTVKFLNGHDIQFLNEKVSTTDRVLYTLSDPTSWPILVLGARNLVLNNTKINWASTSIAMGVNTGVQYGTTGHIEMSDLISAGLVNQISAGKSYIGTANWNMVGGYYTAQIKGEDAHSGALLSRVASQGGYLVGKQFEDALQPIFNPISKSYEWQYIGNGISRPVNLSVTPSTIGTIFGSSTSEGINQLKPKEENK